MSDQDIEKQILRDLLDRHGPLMSGEPLRLALGYPSLSALRRAVLRKTVSINVFTPPKRRGKFALTLDVARWLAGRVTAPSSENQRTRHRGIAPEKEEST